MAFRFVALFLLLPASVVIYICVAWGFVLLSCLSYLVAKVRGASVVSEIWKHAAVAVVAIALSKAIGACIPSMLSFS